MSKSIEELRPHFEPQDRFDLIHTEAWRRFGPRLIDLSYANAYEGPDHVVVDAIRHALDDDSELSFQYTPYAGRTMTRRLIATRLTQEYGLPFMFRDVVLTPGAMAALNISFRTLLQTGDELLVLTPCWIDYPLYLANLEIDARFVALNENKHLDLEKIRQAIGPRTKGIIFSQPGCPTGVLYSPEEIQALTKLLLQSEREFGHPIYWISDEVHRHLVWSEESFYSPLRCYPRCIAIYSFGKALFLQGQRIGYVAVSPSMPEREAIRQQLERCVRMMGFCTPTNLMQRAVCNLLDYKPPLAKVAELQREIRAGLSACKYQVCPGTATFFIYVKSPTPDEYQFVELLAKSGVVVLPSSIFCEPGYFRISVTARPEAVLSSIPAFAKALDETKSFQHV